MTPIKVIALYTHKSSDPECLSFREGEVIEVRCKLKSGWWEGSCNGKDGWFPSNYVKVISDSPADQSIEENCSSLTHTQQTRLSMGVSIISGGEPEQSQWILQSTEDGSAVYYYNTVTHEMRQTLPVESAESQDQRPSSSSHIYTNFYESEDEISSCLANGTRLLDQIDEQGSPNVGNIESMSRSVSRRHSSHDHSTNRHSAVLDYDGQFPVNTSRTRNSEKRNTLASFTSLRSSGSTLLTWEEHFVSISNAIESLNSSQKEQHFEYIKENTALVVQRIRLLLCVSNTIDKESSPYLQENKQLRAYHRALLAALAKMVLSSKVASGSWPPSDSFLKLTADAGEVLTTLRKFLRIADEMLLEVHEYTPRLSDETFSPFRWRVSANIPGAKPDPMTTLLVLAHNVRGAKASFMESLRNSCPPSAPLVNQLSMESIAPLLVAQFRNLSNTTSQFLNSVDDISEMNPACSTSLTRSKQSIYEAMGTLFVATQSVTDEDLSAENVRETSFPLLISCIDEIERGIKDVCNSCQVIPDPNSYMTAEESELFNTLGYRDSPSNAIGKKSGYNTAIAHTETNELSNPMRHQLDKVTKFFGEDTLAASRRRDTILAEPATPIPGAPVVDNSDKNSTRAAGSNQHGGDRQGLLAPDYSPSEIIFNMEGNVKGGTVDGLVRRLTQHDKFDSKFITTFLLTYRSFCSSEDLFELLFERYTLLPPPGLGPDDLEIWNEKKLKLIRLRVFNVIKSWLETYYNEEEGRSILPRLLEFTDEVIRQSMQFGAEQLIKLIRKRMDAENISQIRKMTLNVRTSDMPVPLLPKNMKRMDLLQINHLELARQLTIMDSTLYSRIKPVECLDKNWGKNDSENMAGNVKASIEYSNQVTAWVTDSILCKDDPKKRAKIVKHWIFIAEQCRILNNFNTCMAILSAFDNSSIGRLRRTWSNVDAMPTQILSRIRRLMGANRNFIEYREIIHKVNPPCIPFLGIYLQDLTFIEDGNSNYLKKTNNLINFAKRMKTADVIRELQQHQSTPYLLQAVPDIQQYITTHLQSSRDEETLYDLSLAAEPKERGEDTMARKLKESVSTTRMQISNGCYDNRSYGKAKNGVEMKIMLSEKERQICDLLRNVSDYIAVDRPELQRIESRIAGGWVRDKLLGEKCDDIDVAVNDMMGYEFAGYVNQYLESVGGSTRSISKIDSNPAKSKHLETATTKLFDQEIDFCNLRTEEYSDESRIPSKITFGTPTEDAYRRDITINSLFYNVNSGLVEDFTEKGIDDLKLGIVRTPLDPFKTFEDDPLRVIRCIRFASRLDFVLDPKLSEEAKSAPVKNALVHKISRERIGTELEKMLKGPSPLRSLRLIADLELYPIVFAPPASTRSGSVKDPRLVVRAFGIIQRLSLKESISPQLTVDNPKELRMLYLAASVLPYIDVMADDKKKQVPAAQLVLRDSIKMPNLDNKNINTIYQEIPLILDAVNKNTNDNIGRGELGVIIQRLGTLWRSAVKLCLVIELELRSHIVWDKPETVNDNDKDVLLIQQKYDRLITKAVEYNITDCYTWKHMIDGKGVAQLLGIKPGPAVADLLKVMMRWQLDNPDGTQTDCEVMLKRYWNEKN